MKETKYAVFMIRLADQCGYKESNTAFKIEHLDTQAYESAM